MKVREIMSTMHSGPAGVNPTRVYPRGQAPAANAPESPDAPLEPGTGHAPNEAAGPAGKIEVSTRAIATVAGRAVAQCYGVVGIAARHPRFATVETLPPDQYGRGVEVRFADEHVTIDLYVVLEHGLRISEIAHNIMSNVKFAVERTLGLPVVSINVNVQALRVSRDA
jgi:uncharacterized alkaline shock family protein YloU